VVKINKISWTFDHWIQTYTLAPIYGVSLGNPQILRGAHSFINGGCISLNAAILAKNKATFATAHGVN
jgi:hypothetical protein